MSDGGIGALEGYILGLCRDRAAPRLPPADGERRLGRPVTRFYEAFADVDCEPSHVALFRPHPERVAERLLAGTPSTSGAAAAANLIAIWRVHALGAVLRRAWDAGHRALRGQRRGDLLVRGGASPNPWAPATRL